MVHIHEINKPSEESNSKGISCVRNMVAGESFPIQAPLAISDFHVHKGKKITFEQRSFSFNYKVNKIYITIDEEPNNKPSSPEKVYEQPLSEYQIYKLSESEYELRSLFVEGGDHEYHMSIKYTYEPL